MKESRLLGAACVYDFGLAASSMSGHARSQLVQTYERSRPVLARINEKVDRVSAILMPFILAIVGIALVVDATSYLATGEGLF